VKYFYESNLLLCKEVDLAVSPLKSGELKQIELLKFPQVQWSQRDLSINKKCKKLFAIATCNYNGEEGLQCLLKLDLDSPQVIVD
jgi:hypothetical protein